MSEDISGIVFFPPEAGINIYLMEFSGDALFGAEFICRLAATRPAVIIVQNEHTTRGEERIEMLQANPRGFIPVSVQAEHRDGSDLRRIGTNRILEPTHMETNLFLRQVKLADQVAPNLGQAGFALVNGGEFSSRLAPAVNSGGFAILISWLRQALKGIKKMQNAGLRSMAKGQTHDRGRTPFPHATFNEGSWNILPQYCFANVPEHAAALRRGHGMAFGGKHRTRARQAGQAF